MERDQLRAVCSLSNLAIAYSALVLFTFLCLRVCGDVVLPLTALLYGPRWILLLPIGVLLLLRLVYRLSGLALAILVLAALIVAVGIMDFRWVASESPGDFRVMTFNTLQETDNSNQVYQFVEQEQPALVALQESHGFDFRMPPDYTSFKYGELQFSSKYPVVYTPEMEYAFRGKVEGLAMYDRAFTGSDIQQLHAVREMLGAEDLWQEDRINLVIDDSNVRRGTKVITEDSRRLPTAKLTIAMRLWVDNAQDRRFVVDFGNYWKGFNVYVERSKVVIGAWTRERSGWFDFDARVGQWVQLYLVFHEQIVDVFQDGHYSGSIQTSGLDAVNIAFGDQFALGSFCGTTRCQGYNGAFPNRCIVFHVVVDRREFEVVVVHNATPRRAFLELTNFPAFYEEFTIRSEAIAREAKRDEDSSRPRIVMGDLNLPVESRLYRRLWGGSYANAFSDCGIGYGYSKRTSVAGTSYGSRIDHVLYTGAVSATRARVGPDLGSDHLPVVVDFVCDKMSGGE